MTVTMELDDRTSLDATDVRAALTSRMSDDHVTVHLVHHNGAELVVGFREGRGVCLSRLRDEPEVTTGGTNEGVVLYGWCEIPVPSGAEIDAESVIAAAVEFAATGNRPTGVRWRPYVLEAFPLEDTGMGVDDLRGLLNRGPSQP